MRQKEAKIGIVGGAGPYAGLDLAQKLLQQTIAKSDQEYLPTLLISYKKNLVIGNLYFSSWCWAKSLFLDSYYGLPSMNSIPLL